jgi:hypothetical protein
MTRESWREKAARIVAAMGYLIVWSSKPLNIGQVIRGVSTSYCAESKADQPFIVIGEATEEQFERQLAIADAPFVAQPNSYYYFVETD